ncbi:MAG: RNA polymerase sigma factor [Suilimivivens sp.]
MRKELYEKIVNYIVENQEKFYRLAYSYTGNQEDALDVVQNAVCKILENYKGIRKESAIRTWCYRILVNESMTFLKNRAKEKPTEDERNVEIPYIEKQFEAEDDLYEKIEKLPEEMQNVIKLRFYEELSLKEIAKITEVNLNTVKARLYRGLKLLEKEF